MRVEAEAARLGEARLGAIEDRIDADLACGRHLAVACDLDALVVSHPLRERLWGQRILALYRSGRQAEALRASTVVRDRLHTELGVEPGPALRARRGGGAGPARRARLVGAAGRRPAGRPSAVRSRSDWRPRGSPKRVLPPAPPRSPRSTTPARTAAPTSPIRWWATDRWTSSSCRATSRTSTRGGRRGRVGWCDGWRRSRG